MHSKIMEFVRIHYPDDFKVLPALRSQSYPLEKISYSAERDFDCMSNVPETAGHVTINWVFNMPNLENIHLTINVSYPSSACKLNK